MGGLEGRVQQQQQQPSGFFPNGLLPDEVASVTRKLDPERWAIAEERIAELIACIQPNQPSEERRIAVASYVQRLITKCFPCQVFTFGSVPLKTYLPDGDIDLTAFSNSQNLKETWANEVKDILKREEKSANAEFRVKEVQYIQAEVKIIKCLVENIVVDISFNQLGGLCTLCFLEEVDRLINQNHLFKCSIILIKAWCYYESRILGAHHGLISTYALETLVLYIFHVFNCSFSGPLEVLYRFLEFFSRFDWENYCVSLSGPVPISSFPDMTADPPRKDNGELLLSKLFLDECSNVYSYLPGRQDNLEQSFILKYFNVIDPLRTNNNLGRSVSKGNFFRIRSAFAFGAQRLARLLDCPEESLLVELNRFFMNTWDRHGNGHRPDVPSPNIFSLHNAKQTSRSEGLGNYSSGKKAREASIRQAAESVVTCSPLAFDGTSSQDGIYNTEQTSRSVDISSVPPVPIQKTPSNLSISKVSHANHQTSRFTSSNQNLHSVKGRDSLADYMGNEAHIRFQFPRTHSSPELKDASIEAPSRGRRNKASDAGHGQVAFARLDNNGRKNVGPDVLESHGERFSTENSSKHSSTHQSFDVRFDSSSTSNGYNDDAGSAIVEDPVFLSDTTQMHQEEQDLVNMIPPFNLGGQGHLSANFTSNHPLFPVPPSILASLYAQKGVPNSFQPSWASATHYSQCFVPFPASQYVPHLGRMSNKEERTELGNDNLLSTELIYEDTYHGLWSKQGADSLKSDHHSRGVQAQLHEDIQQFCSVEAAPSCSSHVSSSDSFSMADHRYIAEDQGPSRENHCEMAQYQQTKDVDAHSSAGLRFIPASQASSSGITVSSEDSRDAPSRTAKSSRVRRGRIPVQSAETSVSNGWQYEDKSGDHTSSMAENDHRGWNPLSKGGSEQVVSADVPSHVWNRQMPGYEMASVRESTSVHPVASMLGGSELQQRANDNHGALPYTFYPTGPPVPFLAMLPIYNVPNETGASTVSTNTFTRSEGSNTSQYGQSDHNLESTEVLDQTGIIDSSSVKDVSSMELPGQHRSDILNGDFVSHWQNLQYGRFCQNAQHTGPLLYPSSVVPPMYLQGHSPWDSPGKPAANVNIFTQLMNNTPQLIPISALHHGSSISAGVRQHYAEEIPRYRGGTGTYLPNPKASARARQSSNTRNNRLNYSSDRKDRNSDRDGNWNNSSKSRFGSRNQYSQVERSSVMMDRSAAKNRLSERTWNSKQNSLSPHYSRNGSFSFSNSANRGSPSPNMAYNMHPVPFVNPGGISPSGGAVPSVVMLYPYDQNMGYSSSGEHLEFGSFGPVHPETSARGISKQQDTRGDSDCSSPDQPSSPQVHRPV